jgi:hypothetical protein
MILKLRIKGRKKEYVIDRFELINNFNKYITLFFPNGKIVDYELENVLEVCITEERNEKA